MDDKQLLTEFTLGKSEHALMLFDYFIITFRGVGTDITLYPTKSMIGIATSKRRIAWITQLGKNFIHVVFPFTEPHEDNLCFQKIAQVPGDMHQFNHHFRMYLQEDVNEEVIEFMKLAYMEGR